VTHLGRPWSLRPGRALDAWAATQKPTSLLVVRLLAVANVAVLSAVGALCLLFVSRPAGLVAAALFWAFAAALLAVVPYTDPRRRDGSRW